MRANKNILSIFYVIFLAALLTSCKSSSDFNQPTSIVEPPARETPLAPVNAVESDLLDRTKRAFLDGDQIFWEEASTITYPVLHPRYETKEIFIEEMTNYSSLYDFSCQSVLRYPATDFSDWTGAEEIALIFVGIPKAGEEFFQNSSAPNTISVFEITYLTNGEKPPAYYLYRYGFPWSEGDTVQENYDSFLSMRKDTASKFGSEITVESCP
jgi:hypothetical protein